MPQKNAPEIDKAGGLVTSSKVPLIHLIPTEMWIRLAQRCELGIQRKGQDKVWNALSANQQVLLSKTFIFERLSHVLLHANVLRDKIVNGENLLEKDDDAGAIAWGAMFLCSATRAIEDEKKGKE